MGLVSCPPYEVGSRPDVSPRPGWVRPSARHATILLVLVSIAAAPVLRAQDPFEIQVYEYETVAPGKWELETHLNYIVRGKTEPTGMVAPSERQLHTTFELTRGITDDFEFAGYLLLASRPGAALEIAGAHVRPRVRVPKDWDWPVDISLSCEFGWSAAAYEEDSWGIEIRPIFEKTLGRWQFDLNPTVIHALRGPGTGDGWQFEPAARIAYTASPEILVGLEYYGALGPVGHWLAKGEQVHLLFPAADFHLSKKVVLNVGAGWKLTTAGNGFVVKARVGIELD